MQGKYNSKRGASLLSYGLIVGLISVVALSAVTTTGSSANQLFVEVGDTLTSVSADASSGSASAPTPTPTAPPVCVSGSDSLTSSGTITIGANCSQITITAQGAKGSDDSGNTSYHGGNGGTVTADFAVSGGETFTVSIDGGGASPTAPGGDFAWVENSGLGITVVAGGGGGGGFGIWTGSNYRGGHGCQSPSQNTDQNGFTTIMGDNGGDFNTDGIGEGGAGGTSICTAASSGSDSNHPTTPGHGGDSASNGGGAGGGGWGGGGGGGGDISGCGRRAGGGGGCVALGEIGSTEVITVGNNTGGASVTISWQ